jgi:hypothetical protein
MAKAYDPDALAWHWFWMTIAGLALWITLSFLFVILR